MDAVSEQIHDVWANSKKVAFAVIQGHLKSQMIAGEEFFWSDVTNEPVFLIDNIVYFIVPNRLAATIEALTIYNELFGFKKEIITK